MPRPRHDSEVLPAKERLENAFWELLADRDYRKITVTDVVREAGVNRNSFYYHFSSLPELADSAILHQVESIPINRTKAQSASHAGVSNPRTGRWKHERNIEQDPSGT